MPSNETIIRIADELDLNSDLLLALAGRISPDLERVVINRPGHLPNIIRLLGELNDEQVEIIYKEIKGIKNGTKHKNTEGFAGGDS